MITHVAALGYFLLELIELVAAMISHFCFEYLLFVRENAGLVDFSNLLLRVQKTDLVAITFHIPVYSFLAQ